MLNKVVFVTKKLSRYADFEEINSKSRKINDGDDDYYGDDDEFDDDYMNPEPQVDMADVCTKTTKKTAKEVVKKKSKPASDRNGQKISKAEKKHTIQQEAIKAQKKQAEAMFASYSSKIKVSPVISKGPTSNIQAEESCKRLIVKLS